MNLDKNSTNDFILDVQHVSKMYATHQALNDVSLSVPRGQIFGLLGPNGAGKSTLIRIITQIIRRDTGEISFNNKPLQPEDAENIGYLPEERGLYKKMKVGEQLLYLSRLKGLTKNEAMDRLKIWFEKFDIKPWWNKKVEDLSKGMQQKIQFVATVLHQPALLILDEPFSGFDPINANIIKDEILEMKRKGTTIIFSTHRMESVEELCDHVALINKSQKILDGSKKDIKNSYRTNVYQVEHNKSFENLGDNFEILETEKNDDHFLSYIQAKTNGLGNELLHNLINQTDIISFQERLPSFNDIFIMLVTGKTTYKNTQQEVQHYE
ncbi:MAG: ATP-binding cassette domain-containing protein [Bacteroidetes bacterium]|nr:MAG: ATP-binding cassette domain-containing protein [Bacteroidota bacterium]TAG90480.1 MAG: ATP-binding cassette domain-containing protein [Bacteroidota bacterium]